MDLHDLLIIHCLCRLSNGAMYYLASKIKYMLSLNDIIVMNIIERESFRSDILHTYHATYMFSRHP